MFMSFTILFWFFGVDYSLVSNSLLFYKSNLSKYEQTVMFIYHFTLTTVGGHLPSAVRASMPLHIDLCLRYQKSEWSYKRKWKTVMSQYGGWHFFGNDQKKRWSKLRVTIGGTLTIAIVLQLRSHGYCDIIVIPV